MTTSNTDKLTSLMYSGADKLYAKLALENPGEPPHGYSGVCAGLAEVLQTLGHNIDLHYFANRFHDVLSQSDLTSTFVKQGLSYKDVVTQLDKGFHGFFGGWQGKTYELPHPFANLDRTFRFSYDSLITKQDFQWIADEVKTALKTKKIRMNSKAFKDFASENAQKVIDAAVRIAKQKQEVLAREYQDNIRKAEELLEKATEMVTHRTYDWDVHETMLGLAGLSPAPKVLERHLEELRAWRHVQNELTSKIQHYAEQHDLALDHDRVLAAALGALHESDTLKHFPQAVGL